jgi:hypothetical protein
VNEVSATLAYASFIIIWPRSGSASDKLASHMTPQPGVGKSINNFTNARSEGPKAIRKLSGIHRDSANQKSSIVNRQ